MFLLFCYYQICNAMSLQSNDVITYMALIYATAVALSLYVYQFSHYTKNADQRGPLSSLNN